MLAPGSRPLEPEPGSAGRALEQVKVELVVLSADKLRDQVTVTDQDVASWFDQH